MKVFAAEDINLSIALFFSALGFTFYHFFNLASKKRLGDGSLNQMLVQRFAGVLVFGILPALFCWLFGSSGSVLQSMGKIRRETFMWLGGFSAIIIPMNFLNSKTESNLKVYPQIRIKTWSRSVFILSALSWIAYLLAYEFLLRGVLLGSSLKFLSLWPAIILNTGIYSLLHIPKGAKEAFGAIPMGVMLCLVTISTGSFWYAFFIHVVMALSNEWFSLRFNPDIHLSLKR